MLTIAIMLLELSSAQACPVSLPLGPENIGPVKFSAPLSAVKNGGYTYSSQTKNEEGDDYTDYKFVICKTATVTASALKGKDVILELSTESPVFRTAKGAHVGMTIAQLKALYQNGKTYIGNEAEGQNFASFSTPDGIVFAIDLDHIPAKCFKAQVNCDKEIAAKKSISVYIR